MLVKQNFAALAESVKTFVNLRHVHHFKILLAGCRAHS
jgi:hypothetical protein